MTHTTLDLREPIQHPAEGALEFTGHEQLAEKFRAALQRNEGSDLSPAIGFQLTRTEPPQPEPEPSNA